MTRTGSSRPPTGASNSHFLGYPSLHDYGYSNGDASPEKIRENMKNLHTEMEDTLRRISTLEKKMKNKSKSKSKTKRHNGSSSSGKGRDEQGFDDLVANILKKSDGH